MPSRSIVRRAARAVGITRTTPAASSFLEHRCRNGLDLWHDDVGPFGLDQRLQLLRIAHRDRARVVCDLLTRRVFVAVHRNRLDAEPLQRDQHFLAEFAGAEQHDARGAGGKRRAERRKFRCGHRGSPWWNAGIIAQPLPGPPRALQAGRAAAWRAAVARGRGKRQSRGGVSRVGDGTEAHSLTDDEATDDGSNHTTPATGAGNSAGDRFRQCRGNDNHGHRRRRRQHFDRYVHAAPGDRVGEPALHDYGSIAFALSASSGALNYDQRGRGFPRTLDGMVDIGAFQHQGNRIFADGYDPEP